MAIANAASLARHLHASKTIEEGLQAWEQAERGFTEAVQEWSCSYDDVVHAWPSRFENERNVFIRAIGETPAMRNKWLAYAQGLRELHNPA